MGATDTIAKWIVNTTYEDIPPDAIRVANESCFDVIGVILAGSAQPVGDIIKKYVADQGAAPQATVLSSGSQSSVANAALANGTMGHALDFDDFGGFGHPTVAIFPALLAIGEHSGATGRDLLEAYVVGCEVGLALQHATKYKQMDKGFHSTAVIGRLACTAACAKLMKLDHDQTVMALGMAGSMASGLIHNFGTMTKPLHAGLTCRDGVTAAQLAQRGLTAGDQIIEHPFGFATTVLGEGIYDLDDMAENLGKPYRVQDALMIKKYPCCGGNHAMLDSLFSLMRDNNFTHEDVASAEVDQSYYSVVMLYQDPDDELKGKFSAKFNVAAALVDGEIAVDTFTQEKIADPTINETMGKVRTRVMAKSEEMLTRSEDGHKVKITLKDGRVFEHVTARADILGSQKNPWGFDSIKSKFQENVALVLSQEGVDDAVNAWSDILQVSDVSGTVSRTLS
ncbi:MAG TPA: MmgE/PrpD family protein [Dehalococcoidia bacterium]|jgi:2-methylcitrate dehydratase PrpD|nr:MmgE/PrpD family protein [Chloroflexota bacterium]HIM49380.1 MmgE/PrpD family protein [Dehalococcoidia bacterium]|tara:strand:+ start:3105 stop:4463 length:1359 start_codon:yes stop_codon:yes gene_type:complete